MRGGQGANPGTPWEKICITLEVKQGPNCADCSITEGSHECIYIKTYAAIAWLWAPSKSNPSGL